MAAFSNYMEQAICNWLRGTAMPSAPAALYVALFNGDPTDAGNGGAEVTTTIRTAGRVLASFSAPVDGVIKNNAVVSFGNAAGAATISHWGLFDAQAAGNLLIHSQIRGGAKTVGAESAVAYPVDALEVTVA